MVNAGWKDLAAVQFRSLESTSLALIHEAPRFH